MTPARTAAGDPLDLRQHSQLGVPDAPVLAARLYRWIGASCGHPLRRTAVSVGMGGVFFLLGLALASAGGFADAYVASPGVYLLLFAGVFTLDRLQWGACAFIEQLNTARGAFLVTDDDYLRAMRALLRRKSAWAPVVALFLALFSAVAGLIALSALTPEGPVAALARWLGILPIPSLSPAWFTPPHLALKLVTLGSLLAITLFGVVALLYFSVRGVVGWARAIERWSVIPIPTAVRLRFAGFDGFALRGLAHTSIAVLAAVLFYGGHPTPFLLALVASFATIGLLCGLMPLTRVTALVRRSQAQVTDAVSQQYLATIYPVARGQDAEPASEQAAAERFQALSALQDLMARVDDAGAGGVGLLALLGTALSQLIPLMGFLYPLIGNR
jgi:hypothetical protein